MLFSKDNVIALISDSLINTGVAKNKPEAIHMAEAWLDTKIELGTVHFIHTPNVEEYLKELMETSPQARKEFRELIDILKN